MKTFVQPNRKRRKAGRKGSLLFDHDDEHRIISSPRPRRITLYNGLMTQEDDDLTCLPPFKEQTPKTLC